MARKARKTLRAKAAQENAFAKMIKNHRARYERATSLVKSSLAELRSLMPKEDLKMLKDICMVETPEQKNEAGEVTQASKKTLNKHALLVEARHAMVLQREQRIKDGQRKRSTGRHSKRATHSGMVNFLNSRTAEAKKEGQS